MTPGCREEVPRAPKALARARRRDSRQGRPGEALSAALFEAFGSEIDPAATAHRGVLGRRGGHGAALRGLGKRDRATPRACPPSSSDLGPSRTVIGGIEIYENFSFLTVPFEAAEKVISEARRTGGLPPVRSPRRRETRAGERPPPCRPRPPPSRPGYTGGVSRFPARPPIAKPKTKKPD